MDLKMIFIYIALGVWLLISCGSPPIEIDESTYEPKIVIYGFLYPGKMVQKIEIKRNYAIGQTIDPKKEMLRDALVTITDLQSDKTYVLNYNNFYKFHYFGANLQIKQGSSYRLDVEATIDGVELQASSTTTVPSNQGFAIDHTASLPDTIVYRPRDIFGQLIYPKIAYCQGSTGQKEDAAFFAMSLNALDADINTFIYDNPFGFDLREVLEESENFQIENIKFSESWTRPERLECGVLSIFEITWFQTWFYGNYRAIIYAGDQNFYHFYATHRFVMEADGNLHEPLFDIDGEGIGVFGSALTDTITFYLKD